MQKTELVVVLLVVAMGCASSSGIVQLSPDTYMISKEDHAGIFGSLAKLKADTIREANTFAAKQGKVAIPISSKEKPVGMRPAEWATFEYQFRVVDKDDPEARRTSLAPRADVVIEKTEKVSVDAPRGQPAAHVEAPAPEASTGAEVSIASSVENADVYVDGKFVGNAPLPHYRLSSGVHVIEIHATGYQPWKRELSVAPNASSRVVAQMEKSPQ